MDVVGHRFEAILNKITSNRSPQALAQEIRHLRRHHESSISQRYMGPYPVSEDDKKSLKKLCEKLLKSHAFGLHK